jgi:O-antigen ligase
MNTRRDALLNGAAAALLWALVFSLPLEKGIQFPGLGTISRLIGWAAFAVCGVAALRRRSLRAPNAALVLAAAFTAWSALTWVWSVSRPATATRAATLAQLFAMVWLIGEFCRSRRALLGLMAAYLAGCAASSVWTIVRALLNEQTNYRRFATAGFDPNDLGVTLALALPMALYLAARTRGAAPWLCRAAAAVCVGGILLTASRTALLAAVAAFLFSLLTWRRSTWSNRVSSVALLALFVLGAVRVAPPASRQRLATLPGELAGGTFHSRTRIWNAGVKLLKRHAPLGVGAGAFPDAVAPSIGRSPLPNRPYTAHDAFLSVLVETGAVGFLLFGALLLTLAFFAWMMAPWERALWIASLLVWTVSVSTLTWEHRKPTWLLFGLIMASWALTFRPGEREA